MRHWFERLARLILFSYLFFFLFFQTNADQKIIGMVYIKSILVGCGGIVTEFTATTPSRTLFSLWLSLSPCTLEGTNTHIWIQQLQGRCLFTSLILGSLDVSVI